MAINPETEFPGKIAPSSPQYPYGEAQNITVPGDGTGTPLLASLVNDAFGFQQAVLSESGIVPSGTPDNATDSQYLDGLKSIFLTSSSAPKGVITGLTGFSTPGDLDHDITIRPGSTHSNAPGNVITLLANLTKQIDAPWVAGDNQGGMFSGVVAPDETYYYYLIKRDSDGLVDGGWSLSSIASDRPVGWSTYERIRFDTTDAAGNIYETIQRIERPDFFELKVKNGIGLFSGVPVGLILRTLPVPIGMPLLVDVSLLARVDQRPPEGVNIVLRVISPEGTDTVGFQTWEPDMVIRTLAASANFVRGNVNKLVMTNNIGEVATQFEESLGNPVAGPSTSFSIGVNGWYDLRGRI